jgi:hypothetical protein
MTLLGYQFDKMRVSPEADALLYNHLNGRNNGLVPGYGDELAVTVSGLTMTIASGAAIIGGRLVVIDAPMNVTAPSNSSKLLCITVDLSQINTATGDPTDNTYVVTNKQVTVELRDSLTQQDLQNEGVVYTQPLGSYVPNGSTLVFTRNSEFYSPYTVPALVDKISRANTLYKYMSNSLSDSMVSPGVSDNATAISFALQRLGSLVLCQLNITIKKGASHHWRDILVPGNGFHITPSINANLTGHAMAQYYLDDQSYRAWCYINGTSVSSVINNSIGSGNISYSTQLYWFTQDDYPSDALADNTTAKSIGLKWPLR